MSGFTQAYAWLLRAEGGLSNHPKDRGGKTNHGVTQKVYTGWLRDHEQPVRDVSEITPEEVEALYFSEYWMAAKCDAVPWPLSLAHFDASVNHGVRGAWLIMQRSLGVTADGIPGPVTMGALRSAPADKLVWRWLKERASYYVAIVQAKPDQLVFMRGWLNRLFDLHREMTGK